ncbi:MAG: hypothetical protein NDJ89_00390 [Oligoflexia bacterium]|nr:hypothetical protein [Oligoflexia bacterium]
MWPSFEVRVPGKWVLAGEHAVLRGATAVALPHPEHGLRLAFRPEEHSASAILEVIPGDARAVIEDLLVSIRDEHERLGGAFPAPAGALEIQSTIPIGAGLGSSAALCVALSRWLAEPLGIPQGALLEFATRLEHRFHGQSSGMDVAVIATGSPVSFVRGRGPVALEVRRLPRFTFHDTGLRCRTNDCVQKVKQLHDSAPARAMLIDEAMAASSRLALEGLLDFDRGQDARGLDLIARAMRQGQECFEAWDLMPDEARRLGASILEEGALAVKITGAGGGGMLAALWPC